MKRVFNILFLFLALLPLHAQVDKYPYVVVTPNADKYELSDSDFYHIAKRIVFPVSVASISADSKFYKDMVNEIMPYINRQGLQLQKVIMRGAASPEGPYSWNVTLAQNRVNSVLDLVNQYSKIPSEVNAVKLIPEDYLFLLRLMRVANDPDYNRVESIVDKYIDVDQAMLKEKLQKLDNKKVWRRLLKTYFPSLRTARFVLVFAPPRSVMAKINVDSLSVPQQKYNPGSSTLNYDFSWLWKGKTRIPRRELLSVKTNLLFDFAYMPSGYDRFCPIPNVALEYYPLHGHFTYGASFDCPWWQDYDAHKYFQIRNYQLESRYYFRSGDIRKNPPGEGAAFRGLYLQAYAHVGLYSIMFTEHRGWEGEGAGAGLGLGYVLPLTNDGHWRLEFGAQAGFFRTKYDPFQYECPVDPTEGDNLYYYKWTLDADLFKKRQYRFNWMGPTRVGITLTYDLLYRRVNKNGFSFNKWEK